MNCHDAQQLIHAYVDAELELTAYLSIEQHLLECPGCSRNYQVQQRIASAMKAAPLYFMPPTDLERRVRQAVRGSDARRPGGRRIAWQPLAIAASLLLVAGLSWQLGLRSGGAAADDALAQEVIAGHVRSLMAEHLVDVRSSDQHTVKPWFTGKLDFSPAVADYPDQGFSLVGGRLDYVSHRPVAALVYQRRKHFINLFIWPESAGRGDLSTLSQHGYALVHWANAGVECWAVSDLNEKELKEFARLAQNQTPATDHAR
jgi:anti-sigma factor RsiW